MKTEGGIITYASHADYLKRKPMSLSSAAREGAEEAVKGLAKKADKVALSEEAKNQAAKGADKGLKEDLEKNIKDKIKEVPEKIKDKVVEGKSAGEHLLTQAGTSALKAFANVSLPGLPLPDLGGASEVSKAPAPKEVSAPKTIVNKPGIFFIKGFSLNPFETEKDGLGSMVENIPTSELHKWSEADKVIEQIKRRPKEQPIILVGHGMGGDTAVDIANQLNSIENGFRQVDLLVTMDSIGTDNDIIPSNVRENFNLISDQDMLFNDGPNVARDDHVTHVHNQLLREGHNEMESSPEVQFSVYEKINRTLMNAVARKNLRESLQQKSMAQRLLDSHRLVSPKATLLAANPS